MGKIFYVMGKSSSGKDTIYNMLINDDSLHLRTIVGYTTRPMRKGEEDGREYFFVGEDELEKLESQGNVIECRGYDTVYGKWYYFTVCDEQINLKENNYILIGTLDSFEKVRAFYGDDLVQPIYINVEDGERLSRALAREKLQSTPKYSEMCRRFLADCEDFSENKVAKAGIRHVYENDVLEDCYSNIKRDILEMLK